MHNSAEHNMNKIIILFVIAFNLNCALAFKWKDCGNKKTRSVHFEDIKIKPNEPTLGKQLSIGAKIKIDEPIEPGSISALKIKKYVGRLFVSIPVSIPCIGGYGSCKSDLCKIFQHGPVCQFLKNIGSECGCPLKPGHYKTDGGKPIHLPTAKGLGGLIARGKYSLEWRWLSPKGKELGCLSGEIKLK